MVKISIHLHSEQNNQNFFFVISISPTENAPSVERYQKAMSEKARIVLTHLNIFRITKVNALSMTTYVVPPLQRKVIDELEWFSVIPNK